MTFYPRYGFIIAILVTLIIVSGTYLAIRHWVNKPKSKPKIEDTAIIVEDVKEISQLFITSYYTEFTRYKERDNRFLVLVAKGSVYSGIDLACFDSTNVTIIKYTNGDRHCTVTLPHAKILDAIINPSGFEIFVDEGGFSYTDIQNLKQDAVTHLSQRALDAQINKRAELRVVTIFSEYLNGMGFTSHLICFE